MKIENRRSIVVVDDDDGFRASLRFLLETMTLTPLDYGAPSELMLALEQGLAADCLMLDINLPEQNGFELHDALRRQGHDVPVIFMTAEYSSAVERRAGEAGAIAVLAKPFSDDALAAALQKALG